MKKVLFASALVMSMGMGSAIAAGGPQAGKFGLSAPVSTNSMSANDPTGMISGRYMVGSDMAVHAGFGLNVKGADAKGTDLGIMGGVRKYMRTTDFAPFIGGKVAYMTFNDSNSDAMALVAEFGGEYFFSNNFSVEAAAYFGYGSTSNKTVVVDPFTGFPIGTTTVKYTTFGTQGTTVGVNYYF